MRTWSIIPALLFLSACTGADLELTEADVFVALKGADMPLAWAVVTSFSTLAVLAILVDRFAAHLEGSLRVVLQHVSIGHQFVEFVQGAINLNSVVFFVSSTTPASSFTTYWACVARFIPPAHVAATSTTGAPPVSSVHFTLCPSPRA